MSTSFDTSTAKWLAERNFAVIVKAGDLTDEHVGKGLLHEVWRDHTWDYISRIERTADGKVEIEHLEGAAPSSNTTKNGDTTIVVSEYRVKKVVETFEPDAAICINHVDKIARPKSVRVTQTTTRTVTEEPLED